MTGKRFGKLLVIGMGDILFSKNRDRKRTRLECKCDCGNITHVLKDNLISGKSTSCGCKRKNSNLVIDMTGERIGKLTVIRREKSLQVVKYKSTWWFCRCECGKEKYISRSSLKGMQTRETGSCGCGRKTGIGSRPNWRKKDKGDTVAKRRLIDSYKRGAKKRGKTWELTDEEFFKLTKGNCFYCGVEPQQIYVAEARHKHNKRYYIYNGIDRRENEEGYTKKNSVSCCGFCNISKRGYSEEKFLKWIDRVYKYQNSNKRNSLKNR